MIDKEWMHRGLACCVRHNPALGGIPLGYVAVPDGHPEVGDVLYRTNSDGEPIGDPLKVDSCIDETFFAYGHALPLSARMHTHREPDSFELIARESEMNAYDYCAEYRLDYGGDGDPAEYSMRRDLISRMKAVAARG